MKILKVLLIIILVGGLGALMLTAEEELPLPTEPVLLLPTFGEAPNLSAEGFQDYSARFETAVLAGLASGATQAQRLEAAYALYRIGCYTYFTAPYRAERSFGNGYGGIPDGTVGGYMDVFNRSFKIHSSDASKPYTYHGYYENFSQISEVKGPSALLRFKSFVAAALTAAEMECDAPQGRTKHNGIKGSAILDHEGGTATFQDKGIEFTSRAKIEEDTAADIAANKRRSYGEDWYDQYGLDAPEKTQHTMNKETINPNTLELEKMTDNKGSTYYRAKFDIICNEDSTGFEAQSIKGTSSIIEAIVFDYLSVEIEVYESGYLRKWSSAEAWIGALKVGPFPLKGSTSSSSTTYISYNKQTVEDGIRELWFGDYSIL